MQLFTKHPSEVGETYTEHFMTASSFGVPMILAGFACLMHGFFPFLFQQTGSRLVNRLYERMVSNRVKPENLSKCERELDWCI